MHKTILTAIVLVFSACSGDVENEVPRAQSRAVSVAPVQTPLAADVATVDTVPTPIKVSIEVSVTELPDKRVRIHGTTNLPSATHFILSVQESAPGVFFGRSQYSVAADGSFESQAFGPAGGLEKGVYIAEVSMPFPSVQPDRVKKLIGASGEMLSGPLVGNDFLGVTVSIEKEFTIGGEQAAQAQQERLEDRIKQYDEWAKKIVALQAWLQAAIPSSQKPDASKFGGEWNKFGQEFNMEIQSYKEQASQIEPFAAHLMIIESLEYIRRMFHSTAFEDEKEYNEASIEYTKALKELEQFIADAKSTQ